MAVNKQVLQMVERFVAAAAETTTDNIPAGKIEEMSGEKSVSEKPYWIIPAVLGCVGFVVLVSILATVVLYARSQRRKRKKQYQENAQDTSGEQAQPSIPGFQQSNGTNDVDGWAIAITADETQRSVSESDAQDGTEKTVNETAETQDDATERSAKLQSDTTNKEAEESSKTHETRQQFRPESSLRTDQTNLSTPLATEETEEESTLVNSTTYNKTPLRKHSSFTYPLST